jgi:hypothetical protein
MPKPDHGRGPVASSSLPGLREQSRYVFKYLTPHKILLLVLIHAYCHASIPPKFQALIFKFLLDQIEAKYSNEKADGLQTPKERDPALDSLREELSMIPSSAAHKSLYDVLLELVTLMATKFAKIASRFGVYSHSMSSIHL